MRTALGLSTPACADGSMYIRKVTQTTVAARAVTGAAAVAGVVAGLSSAARADDAVATSVRESFSAAPVPHHAVLQCGGARAVEAVAAPGPMCSSAANCILGSGGGIAIRVGWRPSDYVYIGGAYEMSKQEPNQLYLLGILQQLRGEFRRYFPTGRETMPFALVGVGVHGYGNEWGIDTEGPSGTLGGGLEVELTRSLALELTLAYRPMFFRAWNDSSTVAPHHDAGIAHFVGLEVALEAKDAL